MGNMKYSKHFSSRQTPQSEKIPGSTQVENSAGGYSWVLDDWLRLDRFLVLGTEGGTYYIKEHKLTVDNAEAVVRCLDQDGKRAVARIVEISEAGRAVKNDAALFALALAASRENVETRQAAFAALPRVARTGTHLFQFVEYAEDLRGWGRGLKRAVGRWYLSKDADSLAYQLVKYRQRGGWSHRDLLRLSHPDPKPRSMSHEALFSWVAREEYFETKLPKLVLDFAEIEHAENVSAVLKAIKGNPSVTWEMIPSQFLKESSVWEALLPTMPMTALVRNLARMTANGTLKPMNKFSNLVCDRILNEDNIVKSRLHPISVLGALLTYSSGHGARGKLSWNPISQIVDVLDKAFYISFKNVESTGKRILLGIDVSGSMECGEVGGMIGLNPRTASAAMALVTANVEKNWHALGFSHDLVPLKISPRQRLDDVKNYLAGIPMGGTDCALPILWALKEMAEVDTFIIYTDSETWYGKIHPAQALREYRRRMGIPAKLIVVGMMANEFTIADPNDRGMLDCVGFDVNTPNIISDFIKE